jgi:hypothetical protein
VRALPSEGFACAEPRSLDPPPPSFPVDPTRRLVVNLTAKVLSWRRGPVIEHQENYEVLSPALCDSWRAHGEHRDTEDTKRDRLVLMLGKDSSEQLLDLSRSVAACVRPMRTPGGVEEVEVFEAAIFHW